MVIVHGSVLIQEGKMEEAVQLSLEHVHRSRAEPGCISHAVHRDCENERLVFFEEWEDQASLQEHFKVPESRTFVERLTKLASAPPEMAIYDAQRVS